MKIRPFSNRKFDENLNENVLWNSITQRNGVLAIWQFDSNDTSSALLCVKMPQTSVFKSQLVDWRAPYHFELNQLFIVYHRHWSSKDSSKRRTKLRAVFFYKSTIFALPQFQEIFNWKFPRDSFVIVSFQCDILDRNFNVSLFSVFSV